MTDSGQDEQTDEIKMMPINRQTRQPASKGWAETAKEPGGSRARKSGSFKLTFKLSFVYWLYFCCTPRFFVSLFFLLFFL